MNIYRSKLGIYRLAVSHFTEILSYFPNCTPSYQQHLTSQHPHLIFRKPQHPKTSLKMSDQKAQEAHCKNELDNIPAPNVNPLSPFPSIPIPRFPLTAPKLTHPQTPYYTPFQQPPSGTLIPTSNSTTSVPKLFQPLSLRGLTLQNRIIVSPMCQYSSDNGHQTFWHHAHLGGIISRGPGLTILEATAVAEWGRM